MRLRNCDRGPVARNRLVDDRDIEFLLYEVHDAEALARLPGFAEYDRETFDMFVDSARRLARDHLWPAYRPMDEAPPPLVDGRVEAHPIMRAVALDRSNQEVANRKTDMVRWVNSLTINF